MGELDLFLAGMAARAGISPANARDLALDAAKNGFAALFQRAGLPRELLNGFQLALDVVLESGPKTPAQWSEHKTLRIIQRLVGAYDTVAPAHLETVLAQIGGSGLGRPLIQPERAMGDDGRAGLRAP